MSERRVLLGILVYNGLDVVPRCLESAAGLVSERVDVVVFDDCSPAAGFSGEVEGLCRELGIGYYRTPRNLGIPRNMSLVLKTALAGDYGVAGLVNSDVVLPTNLVDVVDSALDAAAASGERIGSVTPWSNNVSAFSLPMRGALPGLTDAAFVSALSSALHSVNGAATLPIPTGVGYCLLMPVDAIREVGIMDPIFGRGYCEEVDWCQRARLAGFQNVLSLGSFVFHEGSATSREAGLLAHGMTTVAEHELIVIDRYPDYRANIERFLEDNDVEALGLDAMSRALTLMVKGSSYELVISDSRSATMTNSARVVISGDGADGHAYVAVNGLVAPIGTSTSWTPETVEQELGPPASVSVLEPGAIGRAFTEWATGRGMIVTGHVSYPTRV